MTLLIDYHTHTHNSSDARGSIAELVEAAAQAGITHLAVTEHVDFVPFDSGYGFFSPERYSAEFEKTRPFFANVDVRQGIELGIEHEYIAEALAIKQQPIYAELDFVIGSVHAVDGHTIGSADYYLSRERNKAFRDYLLSITHAIKTASEHGLIDVIGHLDVLKRYAPEGYCNGWLDECSDILRALLKSAVQAGIGLEINVSGLRQGPKEQYPEMGVLKMYKELGGEILTIGSDSHSAATLLDSARYLAQGMDIARQAGFGRLTVFKNRTPQFIRI